MKLSKRVKIGLDETRMLVLGVQVLIGFQFRSVFEKAFGSLPEWSRYLDGVSLLLMVCALGLLILPGLYHRIVEEGCNSGRLCMLIGTVAWWALAPFAISMGLAVGISCERVWGAFGGLVAGIAASLGAFGLWYGLGEFRKGSDGRKERAMSRQEEDKTEDPGLHEKIDTMLTEARVILPGAQALLGFQLAIVLTEGFENLEPKLKSIHGLALLLICLSVLLLMAPAAYHRIVYAGQDSPRFQEVGSRLITFSTFPLAMGVAADVFVVSTKIWESTAVAATAGLLSLGFLIGAWHLIPISMRAMRGSPDRQNHASA
jgi:hypothetical protein